MRLRRLVPSALRGALKRLVGRLRQPDAPRPKAWLGPEEESWMPERELWIGPGDPVSHYYRWIWEYLAYLTLLCDLRREGVVLDLGCGHGRLARGLLGYLWFPGRYIGLDVDVRRIEDAKQRIQSRVGNFEFVHADVYNRDYNPGGSVPAAEYEFPFGDGTFDAVFAASLFTHLLPQEAERYVAETARVLKPGGRAILSCFLLDHYRGPGTTVSPNYEFTHPLSGGDAAVRDPEYPDAAIGYTRAFLTAAAARAGLTVKEVLPGWWSNAPGRAVNEQDLLLLEKPAV